MSELTHDDLAVIARTYDLPPPPPLSHAWRGATSCVVPCGEAVIKIPFETSEAIQALRTDVAMNVVARRLGVQTPALLAFDDACQLVPMPYALYRQVRGAQTIEDRPYTAEGSQEAWVALGRELALVHAVTPGTGVPVPLRAFRQTPDVDPRTWVTDLFVAGRVFPEDAAWLHRLLEQLAPVALAGADSDHLLRLCHGDVHASNVLVAADTGAFKAVIDWAGAGWLDPVWDFAGIPLAVVPWVLAGHRAVAPLPDDATAEARICWSQLQTRLYATLGAPASLTVREQLRRQLAGVRAFVAHTALMP